MLRPRTLLALFGALLLSSCVSYVTPPGTSFASSPPGARVLIDGQDSGYATPCMIHLQEDEGYRVEILMEGYEPALMRLEDGRSTYLISWGEGTAWPPGCFPFPLLLPMVDIFVPIRVDQRLRPTRVYVDLKPLGAP